MFSSRTRVSSGIVTEPPAGQRLLAALERLDDLLGVAWLKRSDVAAVHRRHRRHVARAEALELAYVDVVEVLAGLLDRVVDRLRVLRHARDARADPYVLAADRLGVEHVVEGR